MTVILANHQPGWSLVPNVLDHIDYGISGRTRDRVASRVSDRVRHTIRARVYAVTVRTNVQAGVPVFNRVQREGER